MRKILCVLLFVVALPMLASAYEDCGIRFSDLHGQVAVRPDEEFDDAYEYASLDTVLRFNDRIWTEIDSGAILSLTDMSTFVVKQNTIMVLPKPETQVSSIKILSGNVWINMKKMVEGGEFNIEMNQAVAGIKGTNIVCGTSPDSDIIRCLRGRVQIRVRTSGEIMDISAGEQAIISGGKSKKEKIDVGQIEKEWKKDTDKMGSAMQDTQLIDAMAARANSIIKQQNELNKNFAFIRLQKKLLSSDLEIAEKCASRLNSQIVEAKIILANASNRMKLSKERAKIFRPAVMKLDNAIKLAETTVQAVLNFIKKAKVRPDTTSSDEIFAQLLEKVNTVLTQFKPIQLEFSTANGRPQDWFEETADECANLVEVVTKITEDANEIPPESRTDIRYRNIITTLGNLNRELALLSRYLKVPNIEYSIIDSLKNFEENISDYIAIYNQELDKYNSIDKESTTSQSKILAQSLRVVGGFARIKRQYTKAQRLYAKVIRSVGSSRYKTAEMQELEDLWKRIQDSFASLSDLDGVIQSKIADLESQINSSGKLRR
ncbi:MAG: FecR domain-containing protein [Candidatus Riflebacteria bacterium]|nr:FecR domain-containing protein [Candidatus Riflebacteria bacterium]